MPNFNRRRFLQGLGVSAAAIPFVIGLDSLYANAAAPVDMKKRFLFMYTPNGGLYSHFRLRVQGASTPISDGKALADPNLVYHPLQANADQLMVLDRLSWVSARQDFQTAATAPDKTNHPGGHQKGMGSLLTGTTLVGGTNDFGNAGLGSGISLDQVIATKVFSGKKFPSLEVGVQVSENLTDRYVDKRVSYDGAAKPRAPNCDPFALFTSLFGTPGGTKSDKELRSLLDSSVLDNAYKDFQRLQPKLSSADQKLLQQHADSVRALENQLGTVVDCGSVMPPTAQAGVNSADATATHKWAMLPANFPIVGAMMTDIIVEAIACGLTNVVTFMWANSEANLTYPWIPGVDTNSTRGHHDMSHARDPNLVLIDQWYATQFNRLIDKLKAVPDSGAPGSVLDNSLLMWSSCLGDAAAHQSNNVPVVLAGSNGGYFQTGRNYQFNDTYTPAQWAGPAAEVASYIGKGPNTADDFAKNVTDVQRNGDQQKIGTPDLTNNDLAVSILNSFGLNDTTFGDPRFCHGALPHIKKA